MKCGNKDPMHTFMTRGLVISSVSIRLCSYILYLASQKFIYVRMRRDTSLLSKRMLPALLYRKVYNISKTNIIHSTTNKCLNEEGVAIYAHKTKLNNMACIAM